MKRLILLLIAAITLMPDNVVKAATKTVFSIDLDETTEHFISKGDTFTRYYNFQVNSDEPFEIELAGLKEETKFSDIHISLAPGTYYEKNIALPDTSLAVIRQKLFETFGNLQLNKSFQNVYQFQVTYRTKNSRNDTILKIWNVTIETGTEEFVKNSNYIFVSAIKSIAGFKPKDELFDLNAKFKYGENGRFFSFMSLDFSFTDTSQVGSTVAGQGRSIISEADFSANYFAFNNSNDFERLNRLAFLGAGAKIFNGNLYTGFHIGSLEIGNHMHSSYAFIGYYYAPYLYPVRVQDGTKALPYRHNIYTEFTLASMEVNSPVFFLNALRLKLGVMFPIAIGPDIVRRDPNGLSQVIHSGDQVTPSAKDIQARLVLEIPIGRIFKF